MTDAAGHGNRLAYLILQTRMVAGIVFLAQETQTMNQFFHALQPMNAPESDHAAEIRSVLIGMNLVLIDDRERTFVFFGEGIQLMPFNRRMEINFPSA